ncbi:IS30 family transposase [Enterococcus faecium]|uniref:IS30 family transposase n=1 Tax=Lactobacillales TaxID=186826 RepID=UPI00268677D7
MPNRSADSMEKAIRSLIESFPKGTFQSFTTDRGKEFSYYPTIEKELKTPVYFADPYSSWQRGSNENSNGLLREFFSKGTNFDYVKQDELQSTLYLINNRPRKCLGYRTAYEVFMVEVLHLI